MKLVIQIPAYNEASSIRETLRQLPKKIVGIATIDILLIDDGSADETVAIAKACGVKYIMSHLNNQGLAKSFIDGIDFALRLGADIIVQTDADNQYQGADIEKIIQPLLLNQADIVIGRRPIQFNPYFTANKKRLQQAGSFGVSKLARLKLSDVTSGFRAYNRLAALHLNVINDFTYTVETLIQASQHKLMIVEVPISVNETLRPSRLAKSTCFYLRKSCVVIFRTVLLYRPLFVFLMISLLLGGFGLVIGCYFLYYYFSGDGAGHLQVLILMSILFILSFMTFIIGLLSDLLKANRKILEEVQLRLRQLDYDIEVQREDSKSFKRKS
ncbi:MULTISPECIES: glycosyltransferase family 2 protein [unclassified Enterococcus]|uniref:glycosyltransferase family 2 protein n=1 Tax=unclassified Enterococcus TaxID=2608891 RepID=UPI0015550ECD|nr:MULTISPECIES: glycosyltransferase family 2 protein [unclassified Enterococcus]MBS7576263.1 glycosyltransferase family 2 protein [Enterococcus sp. MMGLQ5-2]MBS7583496.1 glycosyltransferase family 2 protein [Enterococcus sp. MMGLQ5-1]NPD11358.1 glycosyltransferase family 2 protein [Enterococcus sp. MMGLQ5-1]NPD36101.1 glycosyltransferase family 2 protein [Enterococcus sp. MMGLQ5-2]